MLYAIMQGDAPIAIRKECETAFGCAVFLARHMNVKVLASKRCDLQIIIKGDTVICLEQILRVVEVKDHDQ